MQGFKQLTDKDNVKVEDLVVNSEYKNKLRKRVPNHEVQKYDFDYQPLGWKFKKVEQRCIYFCLFLYLTKKFHSEIR